MASKTPRLAAVGRKRERPGKRPGQAPFFPVSDTTVTYHPVSIGVFETIKESDVHMSSPAWRCWGFVEKTRPQTSQSFTKLKTAA
jgi:hypothetical protein